MHVWYTHVQPRCIWLETEVLGFMSNKSIFWLLPLLGNKHERVWGWWWEDTPPLLHLFIQSTYLDPREVISLAPPGLQPCRVQGKLWARASLGSPLPSSQQPPRHEPAHQRGQRLTPTPPQNLQTPLWACTPESPKLRPQPWFLTQRSLTWAWNIQETPENIQLWDQIFIDCGGGRGRGKKGEADLQIPCNGCQPKFCLFLWKSTPRGAGSLHPRN